jgi:glycosyltransferase involved in cell wall biosynthesis
MHILLIHQAFASIDEPGGTRHYELAQYLTGRGHEVTVITSPVSYLTGSARPPSPSASAGSLRILNAYTYPALHRSFVHRMLSFLSFMFTSFSLGIRVHGVDLVWGTSPPIFQGLTAWALARLKHIPFLFEVRDLWPAFAVGVGVLRQPFLIKASEWLERFLYHHADLILVNSPGFIDHVKRRGARQVELVPNGADPAMFDPASSGEEFRRIHQLGDGFVVLYAGAHGMSNDLTVVLQAAALLPETSPVSIVLVGDGKEKPALLAQAMDMGLRNVRFISPVPKQEMAQVLAAADACLAILKPVDLYKTVFPNKVFDYMAAGRPVILAIDGVIRELVEGAGAGIFVPPGNPQALASAILELAAQPENCKAMGLQGRQIVETCYNRADLANRLEEIFEGLAKRSEHARGAL